MDTTTAANIQTVSFIVQGAAAVAIVGLTVWLARTAKAALGAADKQATAAKDSLEAAGKQADAATRALAEMRRDRHFGSLPMLKVTFDKLEMTSPISVVMHLQNRGDAPVLNVHAWMSDCLDLFKPNENQWAIPTPVAMIWRDGEFTVPINMSRFTPGVSPSLLRTDWVYLNIQFEGLLGARITQEWYWEPDEWEGQAEPVLGHGEKLVLHRIRGTSGAEPDDIKWERKP